MTVVSSVKACAIKTTKINLKSRKISKEHALSARLSVQIQSDGFTTEQSH